MQIAEPETLLEQTVYDAEHQKVGKIKQLYVDDRSHELTWAAISTGGLFGKNESMLPLEAVHEEEDGLVVDLPKDVIEKAPQVDAAKELTERDQETLLNFYNAVFRAQRPTSVSDSNTRPSDTSESDVDARRREETNKRTSEHQESGGQSTDDAMTRSEERLNVDKERREHAHLRLKKYVVTEHKTVNMPLKKEKLRLEREPITDENRDAAMSGDALSEAHHDITLHEEVPKVTTDTVPVERVRMTKDTTEHSHSEKRKLRKEQLGVENLDDENKPE